MAITYLNFGSGIVPDVSWDGADWYLSAQIGGNQWVWKNGVVFSTTPLQAGSLTFIKLDGRRAVLRDGSSAYAWPDITLDFATTRELLIASNPGNDMVGLGFGQYAWLGASYAVQRRPYTGGASVTLGAGTPAGISRVLSTGQVVLVDVDRLWHIDGVFFGTRPSFSQAMVAVEGIDTGVRVWWGSTVELWPGEQAFTPRVAMGATQAVVATWGAPGLRVALIDLTEFVGTTLTEAPVPGSVVGSPVSGLPNSGSNAPTPQQKIVEAAKLAGARKARPVFPHVENVQDHESKAALRILFDRIFEVEQQIVGPSGVNSQITGILTTQATRAAEVERQFQQLSIAGTGTSLALGGAFPTPTPPGGGGGGGGCVGIANQLAVVEAARTTYDAFTGVERAGRIVNQVAWDLQNQGVGVVRKTSGTNWMGWSIDVIMIAPGGATYDILQDAEGNANPQWSRTSPTGCGDIEDWQAPVDPSSI